MRFVIKAYMDCPPDSTVDHQKDAQMRELLARLDSISMGIDRLVAVLAQRKQNIDTKTVVELVKANIRQGEAMSVIDQHLDRGGR